MNFLKNYRFTGTIKKLSAIAKVLLNKYNINTYIPFIKEKIFMKYINYKLILFSLITLNIIASDHSLHNSPKVNNVNVTQSLLELIKRSANLRILKNINPNDNPQDIAQQLNQLLQHSLYKKLWSVTINIFIGEQPTNVTFQKCFLKGTNGNPNITKWVAQGYLPQRFDTQLQRTKAINLPKESGVRRQREN